MRSHRRDHRRSRKPGNRYRMVASPSTGGRCPTRAGSRRKPTLGVCRRGSTRPRETQVPAMPSRKNTSEGALHDSAADVQSDGDAGGPDGAADVGNNVGTVTFMQCAGSICGLPISAVSTQFLAGETIPSCTMTAYGNCVVSSARCWDILGTGASARTITFSGGDIPPGTTGSGYSPDGALTSSPRGRG